MIQHHNGLCLRKKLLTLRVAWFIGIHHDHNGIVVHNILCLRAVHKHMLIIIRIVHKILNDRAHRHGWIIYNNMGLLIQGFCCPVDTDTCTDRVHIGNLVSHDHHFILGNHKFFQGMCLHTCLHTGILAHLLGFPAKICHALFVLDHHLVTAAAKGKVNGDSGVLIILGIAGRIDTDTDTDGHCHVVSDVDGFYVFQNIETFLLQFLQRTLAHHKYKLVFFQLLHKTVYLAEILVQLSFYQSNQK